MFVNVKKRFEKQSCENVLCVYDNVSGEKQSPSETKAVRKVCKRDRSEMHATRKAAKQVRHKISRIQFNNPNVHTIDSPNAVKDRKKSRLKGILEHGYSLLGIDRKAKRQRPRTAMSARRAKP